MAPVVEVLSKKRILLSPPQVIVDSDLQLRKSAVAQQELQYDLDRFNRLKKLEENELRCGRRKRIRDMLSEAKEEEKHTLLQEVGDTGEGIGTYDSFSSEQSEAGSMEDFILTDEKITSVSLPCTDAKSNV